MKASHLLTIAIGLLGLPLVTTAAVPTSAPSTTSAPVDGYFAEYFRNIAKPTCTGTNVVRTLDGTLTLGGSPTCTDVYELIHNYITNTSLGTPDIDPIISAYLAGFVPAPTPDSVVHEFDTL
jgi:hypothetical protein